MLPVSRVVTLTLEQSQSAQRNWISLLRQIFNIRYLQRLFAYTGFYLKTCSKEFQGQVCSKAYLVQVTAIAMDPVDHVKRKHSLLPWETGFAFEVLGSRKTLKTPAQQFLDKALNPKWGPEFVQPSVQKFAPLSTASSSIVVSDAAAVLPDESRTAFSVAARRRQVKPWKGSDDAARHRALARWI